jgi:hypothetical protein
MVDDEGIQMQAVRQWRRGNCLLNHTEIQSLFHQQGVIRWLHLPTFFAAPLFDLTLQQHGDLRETRHIASGNFVGPVNAQG